MHTSGLDMILESEESLVPLCGVQSIHRVGTNCVYDLLSNVSSQFTRHCSTTVDCTSYLRFKRSLALRCSHDGPSVRALRNA